MFGVLHLAAADAETHGAVQYESGGGKDNLGYWTDAADWAEWPVHITTPGTFTVTAEIAALSSGSFQVEVYDPKKQATGIIIGEELGPMRDSTLRAGPLVGTAPNTGDYTKFQTVTLGTLTISAAGPASISVHPVAQGWQPMNLKSLTLTPVR